LFIIRRTRSFLEETRGEETRKTVTHRERTDGENEKWRRLTRRRGTGGARPAGESWTGFLRQAPPGQAADGEEEETHALGTASREGGREGGREQGSKREREGGSKGEREGASEGANE